MLTFSYEAKDPATGKHIKATIQAESESAAAKLLNKQGYIPTKITNQDQGGILAFWKNRITAKDKVVFSRQLSTLIGAGLPLTQSLQTTIDQTENKQLVAITQEILTSVEGGGTLAEAFAKHPEAFDGVFVSLVEAGESSGTLDKALIRLANQQEKDAEMMSKIRGAMIYPLIVLVVIFLVLGFMLFTVVPQIEKLYEDLNQTLPWVTQIMVGTANFVIHFWWLVLILFGIGGYFLRQYLRTEEGIKTKDNLKLNVPIFGTLFSKLYMARFARTSQTLLSTGVPVLDTLKISSKAINNTIVSKSIDKAATKVKGGKGLAESLKGQEYILPLVPQMIGIGEKSGKVDEMMGKIATVYENELDDSIKAISTSIEPILMVVLALVAGTMVAAILLPIYNLVNTTGAV